MLNWFKAAGIRALRSVAGSLLALIGTNAVSITDLDWMDMLAVSATAGAVSLLLAVKGLPEIPAESVMDDKAPGRHEAE